MRKQNIYIIVSVVILLLIAGTIYYYSISKNKDTNSTNGAQEQVQNSKPVAMCYYYTKLQENGYSDTAWIKMNITGDKVSGEYANVPAEKDSMRGNFTGTIGAVNPSTMSRIATLFWDTMGEGMETKQELNIVVNNTNAFALYGEMVDRGDGVYVYKDSTNLTPGQTLPQIDCSALEQIFINSAKK